MTPALTLAEVRAAHQAPLGAVLNSRERLVLWHVANNLRRPK